MRVRLKDFRGVVRNILREKVEEERDLELEPPWGSIAPAASKLSLRLFPYKSTTREKIVNAWLEVSGEELDVWVKKFDKFFVDHSQDIVDGWVTEHFEELMKITNDGHFERLGSGFGGDAYRLEDPDGVDTVLKLEADWDRRGTGPKGKKVQRDLWGKDLGVKDPSVLRMLPMVYSNGEIDAPGGGKILWQVMELFEPIPKKYTAVIGLLLYEMQLHYVDGGTGLSLLFDMLETARSNAENYAAWKRDIAWVAEGLRLDTEPVFMGYSLDDSEQELYAPKWMVDLARVLSKVRDRDVDAMSVDPDVSNLGMRRLGPNQVEWVFFD